MSKLNLFFITSILLFKVSSEFSILNETKDEKLIHKCDELINI
jgi:hypothetical protein